jgi:nucleoside-diphosphate-sugar epimerase
VVCVDNLITGRKFNIIPLLKKYPANLVYIKHDVTHPFPKPLTIKNYSLIANFACPASPKDYLRFPLETLRVSSIGTENLLKLAQKNSCRFFHASTSEVYGDPRVHPQKESYWGYVNTYGVRSMYDEGKRYAEALIYTYRRKYQLNTGIARIFNTYGPKMKSDDGRVVSNFITQALASQPLTIYGKGDQSRSFCYVEDEIKGLVKMALSDLEGPINIGNPDEFTVLELAEKVIKLTGSKSKIVYHPLPSDDPRRRQPDISLAKTKLHWQPEITLEEGLKKTIEWFRSGSV